MVAADMFDYTRKAFWGGPWYSYWMLMVATIFFGFFGVDHFMLKSPMTGAIKFLVNIFGLGIWYFYDMLQVLGDSETVKAHGLTLPLVGAAGIGAGACADGQEDAVQGKSPLRLMAYLFFALMPFGIDNLVGGDSKGAAAKFITTVFPLFWPVALLWSAVSIGRAFFMPRSLFTEGLVRPFPVSSFMDSRGPNVLGPVDLPVEGTEGCDRGGGFFTWILGLVGAVFPGVFPAVTAVTGATSAVAGTVQLGAETASAALGVAKKGIETVEKVALPLVASGAEAIAQTGAVAGAVGQQLTAFTDPTRLAQMAVQTAVQKGGGGTSDGATTGLFLLFAGILAGGTFLAAKRLNLSWKGVSRENGSRQQRNDSPPQPHGF